MSMWDFQEKPEELQVGKRYWQKPCPHKRFASGCADLAKWTRVSFLPPHEQQQKLYDWLRWRSSWGRIYLVSGIVLSSSVTTSVAFVAFGAVAFVAFGEVIGAVRLVPVVALVAGSGMVPLPAVALPWVVPLVTVVLLRKSKLVEFDEVTVAVNVVFDRADNEDCSVVLTPDELEDELEDETTGAGAAASAASR